MYYAYQLRYLGIGYTIVHPWHILALFSSVLPRRKYGFFLFSTEDRPKKTELFMSVDPKFVKN
jgi:hypothetical protein